MKNSVTVKSLLIGLLMLVLLIPTSFVSSLIREREQRRDEAVKDIQSSWSGRQTVTGPFLRVPVRTPHETTNGATTWETTTITVMPDELDVSGDLATEPRYRGIYKTILYTAKLSLRGSFTPPDLDALGLARGEILWDRATVSLDLSDLRGVRDAGAIEWAGKQEPLSAGTSKMERTETLSAAVSGEPLRTGAKKAPFSMALELKGSQGLDFVPVGRITTVVLKSPWTSPTFNGLFLPDTRTVDGGGFAARWKILQINRNIPPAVAGGLDLSASRFGVDLRVPVDQYTSVTRAVKYELLFVFLTFLAFFCVEYGQEKRLHPMQYLLIGSAMVLFYLLLLSFSEQMAFPMAYALAAAGTVGAIGGYAHGTLGRASVTTSVSGALAGLYGYLYTLLRLEDYALLLGSLGLFAILVSIMYATRKFDWYGLETESAPEAHYGRAPF